MTDRILVQDLLLRAIIGVHDWERAVRQDLLLNLELEVDLHAAAASDDLVDGVDYRALTKDVIDHVEESRFRLVEALAGSVADVVLDRFPRVAAITVRVDKPGALRYARSVAVQMRRERGT